MRPSVALALLALPALLLPGCRGKILGTATLTGPGTAEAHFESTGAPVALWADTDGRWTGMSHSRFAAHYEIDVLGGSGKGKVGHVACDTKDSSQQTCGVSVTEGNTHRGDCEIRLNCTLPTIPAGPATLRVTGTVGAGTSDVKNMSINVRES
jgi:hypothetical protein